MVEAKVLSIGELLELMQKQQEATALLLVQAVQQLLMQERMDLANLIPAIAQEGGVYGFAAISHVVKGLMLNKTPNAIADETEGRLLDEQITISAEMLERLTDPNIIVAILTEILTNPDGLLGNGNGVAKAAPSLAALLRAIHAPESQTVVVQSNRALSEVATDPDVEQKVGQWLSEQETGTMTDDTKLMPLTPVIGCFIGPDGTIRQVVAKWLAMRQLPLFTKEDLPFDEREKFSKVKKLIRVADARRLLLEATAEGKTRI